MKAKEAVRIANDIDKAMSEEIAENYESLKEVINEVSHFGAGFHMALHTIRDLMNDDTDIFREYEKDGAKRIASAILAAETLGVVLGSVILAGMDD